MVKKARRICFQIFGRETRSAKCLVEHLRRFYLLLQLLVVGFFFLCVVLKVQISRRADDRMVFPSFRPLTPFKIGLFWKSSSKSRIALGQKPAAAKSTAAIGTLSHKTTTVVSGYNVNLYYEVAVVGLFLDLVDVFAIIVNEWQGLGRGQPLFTQPSVFFAIKRLL